jgi:DNA-binding MarR family transcriptional regulator
MTVNQMITLFLIAENPGLTQRDLLVSLGTTDSASSRIIALLSDIGSRNVVGLALVEMKVNVQDRRERHLFLTSKGRRLMEDIGTDFEKPIR